MSNKNETPSVHLNSDDNNKEDIEENLLNVEEKEDNTMGRKNKNNKKNSKDGEFIAALDVGTTTLKCQVLNTPNGECVGAASLNAKLCYPKPGYFEINPDDLWEGVISVIKQAISNAGLKAEQIKHLGISTQRATFMTWRKDDGRPFHNFITWKDLRADSLLHIWNEGLLAGLFKRFCYSVYLCTRSRRYLAGSGIKLTNSHVSIRLLWVLKNIPDVLDEIKKNNVQYGTVDTWLVYKLTGGKQHITDISNAGGSGLYDPFARDWSTWIMSILGLPMSILPKVVDNDYNFGKTESKIFGTPIEIKCVVSDQSASMFGSCCFKTDDLKITLGTGSFINLNTGLKPHGSVQGIYPAFGWKLKQNTAILAEASCNDTGTIIQWALGTGLLNNPSESTQLAYECESSDGVYFIPAFSGLGTPICDDKAASGFLGLKPTTKRCHMVRAILESIAYRIYLALNVLREETRVSVKKMSVDGGVSKNDFICQLLADLTGLTIERSSEADISVLGAAYLVGINAGIWNQEDLKKMRKIEKTFIPTNQDAEIKKQKQELEQWMKVVERFKLWY